MDIYKQIVIRNYGKRSYDSDAAGSAAAEVTTWIYDGIQMVLQFDGTGDLTSTDLSHMYMYGAAVDQILADESVGNDTYWTLTDHQNTVRDLATAVGVVNHRSYNTFGVLTEETANAVDCIFGYTGKMFDEVTELQNNVNRWYNPELGKWLSEDPIGFNAGDANVYRYVGNNTIQFSDPLGLIPPIYFPSNEWLGVPKVPSVSYTFCEQLASLIREFLTTDEERMLWDHYINNRGTLVMDSLQVDSILIRNRDFNTRLEKNMCNGIIDDTFPIFVGYPWEKGLGNVTITLHVFPNRLGYRVELVDTYDYDPKFLLTTHRTIPAELKTDLVWVASQLCGWKPYGIVGRITYNIKK